MSDTNKPLKRRIRAIFAMVAIGVCGGIAALLPSSDSSLDAVPDQSSPRLIKSSIQNEPVPQGGLITEIKRSVLLSEGPIRMVREFDKWGGLYNKNPGSHKRVADKIKEYEDLFGKDVANQCRVMVVPYMLDGTLTGKEFLQIAIELGRTSGVPADPAFIPMAAEVLKRHGVDDPDGSGAINLVRAACHTVNEARREGQKNSISVTPSGAQPYVRPAFPVHPQ